MSLNYYKTETEKVCRSKGWDRAPIDTVWLDEMWEVHRFKMHDKKYNLK